MLASMLAPRTRWLACAVMFVFAMFFCPRTTLGLHPSSDISQYAHTAWTIRDGFLKGGVRSIVQTPDGYLWLATEFGLVHFDGVRAVPWVPPAGQHLPSTNIRSLLAARDGTLWIGTLEGLASWKGGKLNQYPQFAAQNVLTLLEDREGTVWAGTFGIPKAKLCAIHAGVVNCSGEDSGLGQWVWSLYEDGDGRLWAGAESGLWRWKPGPPKRYSMPHPIETAQALTAGDSPSAPLLAADGIWQLAHETIEHYSAPMPAGRFSPLDMFRDRNGGLWVGTLERGLLHLFHRKTTVFAQSDGLSGNHVLSMFEDREGNIWVGTTDGLDRFRDIAVSSITVKQGLSSASVMSILAARDGSVWLGTLDGLSRWYNDHVTTYRPRAAVATESLQRGTPQPVAYREKGPEVPTEITDPGLPDEQIGSFFEDDRGRIWVSTRRAVARFDHGKFSTLREAPIGWANAITADPRGAGVWISYQDHGLVRLLNDKVVERVPWSKLGGNGVASTVVPDPLEGGLWLGFFQGGLVHFRDGQVRESYGKSQGLGSGRIMGIQVEPHGTVWASTEGGLSRVKDGNVATLTTANGLPCQTVHWAMETGGDFWLNTPCGLLRVPRTELEAWASNAARTIHFTRFDSSDGVRSRALLYGYTPRVSKAPDGKLWYANFETASVIDPLRLAINTVPPPVQIEQVTADGKSYDAQGNLQLHPRVRDVGIDYTALSFAAPEKVRFRFKLEGQDKDWREVVNERHVEYTNLAPKSYRFLVKGCNNSGAWNEEGAALEFLVPPAWYQTNWFLGLCVAGFMALLWTFYQLRLQQLARQFNMRLDERVGERTRIARDLHDTLLQSFHGILLHLQTISNELSGGKTKEKLDSVIDQAEQAIIEGRGAVQGLRTSTAERNDLALAVRTRAEEFASETRSRRPDFTVEVEGTPHNLHPILRDEVYRIVGEAMRNAFRHSDAQRIEVEICYDARQLRTRVRDNGKGIDRQLISDGGRQGHFGLRGMRERAKLIGGKLTVWSELDSGTEVELSIPAARAYLTAPGRRRSWLVEKLAGKFSAKDTEMKS